MTFKKPINFLCRRRLNFRSFIQPLETLLVKLTGTHFEHMILRTNVRSQIQFK